MQESHEGFVIRATVLHERGAIAFRYTVEAQGRTDGTLRYAIDGAALREFSAGRIGICVHHPPETCAGNGYQIDGPGDAASRRLPAHGAATGDRGWQGLAAAGRDRAAHGPPGRRCGDRIRVLGRAVLARGPAQLRRRDLQDLHPGPGRLPAAVPCRGGGEAGGRDHAGRRSSGRHGGRPGAVGRPLPPAGAVGVRSLVRPGPSARQCRAGAARVGPARLPARVVRACRRRSRSRGDRAATGAGTAREQRVRRRGGGRGRVA